MNNRFRCFASAALVLGMTLVPGCGNRQTAAPTLDRIEQILSVSFPDDCRVIGGSEVEESTLMWLIVSGEPLPLPENPDSKPSRSKKGQRPRGVPFPASALSNLMAANGVDAEDVPNLTEQRGSSHAGQVGDWQFSYREAATDSGWLTAIETHRPDLGTAGDSD